MEKAKIIPPRELTKEEVNEITNLTEKDINATLLKKYFAIFYGKSAARFQPNDYFTLFPKTFYNKDSIKTTVGRYIYNLLCIPKKYLNKYGYINDTLTEDTISKLESKMGMMILNDELTTKEYAHYMDCAEWLGMNCGFYITPSLDNDTILPLPNVIKRKEELFSQYATEIKNSDINTADLIEKELLSLAKKEIEEKKSPSYDNFKSGVFKFNVAYKKSSIMVGALKDPKTNKINILKSDYVDGISKDEYEKTAQLTVIGGYSRGVATQAYGYESKKYNSALQNVYVNINGKNIDCGTDRYLKITIHKDLSSMFLFRFIKDGNNLVELTPENISNYEGKTVLMRSPMFCKSDEICEHCAGTLFKRIDVTNAGLVAMNLTGNLMNLSMKKMHDSTVKILKINFDDFITEH